MKKQSTLLIIVLIIAVLTVGLFAAIGVLFKDKGVTNEPKKEMLTELEDVNYVQYTNSVGTVTLVKNGDEWTCEEQKDLKLVYAYIDDRMGVLSNIEGTVVADAKKSECGLDEPIYTLTIKNTEKTVKLIVGINEDFELYAMVDGKETIYSIHDSVAEVLEMEASQFVEPSDDGYSYIIDTEEEMIIEEEYEEDELIEEPVEDLTEDLPEELPEDDTTEEDTGSEE